MKDLSEKPAGVGSVEDALGTKQAISVKKTAGKKTATKKKATAKKKAAAKKQATADKKPTAVKKAAKKKATAKAKTAGTKRASTKRAPARRPNAPTNPQPAAVSPDQRHHMIAERAYLRAEARGFAGGDPQEDWLIAEAEIDAMLRQQRRTGST